MFCGRFVWFTILYYANESASKWLFNELPLEMFPRGLGWILTGLVYCQNYTKTLKCIENTFINNPRFTKYWINVRNLSKTPVWDDLFSEKRLDSIFVNRQSNIRYERLKQSRQDLAIILEKQFSGFNLQATHLPKIKVIFMDFCIGEMRGAFENYFTDEPKEFNRALWSDN